MCFNNLEGNHKTKDSTLQVPNPSCLNGAVSVDSVIADIIMKFDYFYNQCLKKYVSCKISLKKYPWSQYTSQELNKMVSTQVALGFCWSNYIGAWCSFMNIGSSSLEWGKLCHVQNLSSECHSHNFVSLSIVSIDEWCLQGRFQIHNPSDSNLNCSHIRSFFISLWKHKAQTWIEASHPE